MPWSSTTAGRRSRRQRSPSSSASSEGGNGPHRTSLIENRLQAAALRRRDDLLGRVHEDVELAAQEPQQEVADAEAGAHPPRARRVAQDEQLPRAIRGRARQPRHIGVAADDAVHDHDVRALDLARRLGEVRHLALDAVGQPSVAQQARGDVLIRWRQLDAHRASRTGFQEFDLDGSDAAAHLEHGSAFDAWLSRFDTVDRYTSIALLSRSRRESAVSYCRTMWS